MPSPPRNPYLSVVIPFFNEQENVTAVVDEITAVLERSGMTWELVCVDDGSEDETGRLLEAMAEARGKAFQVLRMRRNFGQTAAIQAGVDLSTGQLVALMDGDSQNDPADLPRMAQELLAKDLDLLVGWRRVRKDGLLLRRVPSLLANALIRRVTGVKIRDYGCGIKMFRGDVLRRIRLFGEMHRFIPVWIASVTSPQRIGETPVNHRERLRGRSKYGLSRTFRVIPDLLFVFFFLRYRARPGHFFGSIGLFFGAIGSVIMGWLAFTKFVLGENIGDRPLLLAGILALVFCIQFLTTGILAEMLSRVFFESARAQSYTLADGSPGARGDSKSDRTTG